MEVKIEGLIRISNKKVSLLIFMTTFMREIFSYKNDWIEYKLLFVHVMIKA